MGPLKGLKVIELGGVGPIPFCAMLLSDLGAEVIRLARKQPAAGHFSMDHRFDLVNRGRRSIAIDLKSKAGIAAVLRLTERADVIIEGFRPGVAERLGVGPDDCLKRNPRIIYGRMTGWGQDGPLASVVGHDINYIALAGVLDCFGRRGQPPVPPLNLVGDLGGGALYLAFGIMSALYEVAKSGKGQVVDAAMIDGAASMMTFVHAMIAAGRWSEQRGDNFLDTGRPWYDVYETKDGRYISIGAIEGGFYTELVRTLGLDVNEFPLQHDEARWPEARERFAGIFLQRTRDEWSELLQHTDVCFAPVLSPREAVSHPQLKSRSTFVEVDGIVQPAPAPRFSRTRPAIPTPPAKAGEHTESALLDWGFSKIEIDEMRKQGAVA